jgi:hypothetical protein
MNSKVSKAKGSSTKLPSFIYLFIFISLMVINYLVLEQPLKDDNNQFCCLSSSYSFCKCEVIVRHHLHDVK